MCDSRKRNGCESIEYDIKNFLDPSVRLQMEINPFPWNSVPEYLEKHLKQLFESTNHVRFKKVFMEAFKHHTCKNGAIFTAITDIITVIGLQARDYSDIFGIRKHGQLEMILSHLKEKNGKSIFLDQESIPIIEILNGGDHMLMQILATHGCYADISDASSFASRQASVMIGRFLWVICSKLSLVPVMSSRAFRYYRQNGDDSPYSFLRSVYAAALSHLDSSLSSLEPNNTIHSRVSPLIRFFLDPSSIPENFSLKRLFLVTLGICILSLKLEGYRPGYMSRRDYLNGSIKTLEIYFRTINEPYLNVTEVRKLLTGCIFDESKRHLVDGWCKDFEDVIPFCTKSYEPRKLSHLCRCQVRQNYYGSGSTLPAVLAKLDIPKNIKEFLLCRPLEKKSLYFLEGL